MEPNNRFNQMKAYIFLSITIGLVSLSFATNNPNPMAKKNDNPKVERIKPKEDISTPNPKAIEPKPTDGDTIPSPGPKKPK